MTRIHKTAAAAKFLFLATCLFFFAYPEEVQAQGATQVYRNYIIGSRGRPIPIPDPYVVDHVIDGVSLDIGDLDAPRDIHIDRISDHLFVADSGNHRIMEIDWREGTTRQWGSELGLRGPRGIYVAPEDGSLWIADTGKSRILQLAPDGELRNEFRQAQSEVLAGLKASAPIKVLVDKRGYIYYLEGTGAGMIVMDRRNRFRGFFGTNRLGFSLEWWWSRYLATEEQREKLLLSKPTAHTDMYLGGDGFIYTAVGGQSSQQIQKLSPVGTNVFVEKSLEQKLYKNRIFGERRRPWEPRAVFVGVTVDSAGTVSALDVSSGRIYQYDQDRNLLLAFGSLGEGRVEFALPNEVDVDSEGRLYVLDSARSVVYVLRPTRFAQLVHRASALQFDGRYAEAEQTWREILRLAANYELAHSGIGKTYYHEERWQDAMREHRLARDQLGYSLALYEYRQDLLRRNMGWIVAGPLVLIMGVLAWPAASRRLRRGNHRGLPLRLPFGRFARRGERTLHPALGILIHPVRTFESLRAARSLWPAVVLVLLAGLARVASLAVMAFHMRATPTAGPVLGWWRLYRPVAAILLPELRWEESNFLVEMLRIILPWFLWTMANYGVSALFEGEGTFRAVVRTTAYCLVPYILFAVPIALLGHVLTASERGLYESLWTLVYYWVFILLVLEISVVHDYSLRRTAGVGAIIVFGSLMLTGTGALVGLLVGQALNFVWKVAHEIIRLVY